MGGVVGGVLVRRQGQGKGGGCCGRRRRWRVVGEVQGGSRGPVGLGSWGAAPAAAVKRGRESEKRRGMEKGARLGQA